MPVYQRGESWVVSVGSGKDRYRATWDSKQEAEEAELQEKLRRKQKRAGGAFQGARRGTRGATEGSAKTKTLLEAYERTFRLHWKGNKSEYTATLNANGVMNVLGRGTVLSDIHTEDVTEMILELEDQGNSGSTINRKLSALSMMLKTARAQWPGCLPEMPALTRRREGQHRIRWMDTKEEATVLAACDALGLKDLKDYIIVAIDTGFRRGELLGFQVEDYQGGLLTLHPGETKSGKGRAIPATQRVHAIINRRGNFKRLFAGLTVAKLRWQWVQLRTRLGLDEDTQFVVHMLRHTCASRMVQRGVPLAVVQAWMGHATIATTMRYSHLAPTSLLQGKEALEVEPEVVSIPASSVRELELTDF